MFNKVILLGNLTRDIESKYSSGGLLIANSAIATNRKYNMNGEKKEEVCFIDITFFGKTAEVAKQYLKKGSRVLIEGRLKFDSWQDQNGQNRTKHSVTVETMQMLSSQFENSSYNSNNFNDKPNYNDNSSNNFTRKETFSANPAKSFSSENSYSEKNNFGTSQNKNFIEKNNAFYDDEEIPF